MGPALMAKGKKTGSPNANPDRVRRTAPVQIEVELARMAAVIASHRRITQSDLLSPFVRQYLTTEYALVQKAMGKEIDDLRQAEGSGG